MLQEDLDMLFLLEYFSLEDLVKAEEQYINYRYKNTDNIVKSYTDVEQYIDDECTTTFTTREYSTFIDDSWMNFLFESLIFNDQRKLYLYLFLTKSIKESSIYSSSRQE